MKEAKGLLSINDLDARQSGRRYVSPGRGGKAGKTRLGEGSGIGKGETRLRLCNLQMTKSDGERVGGVGGLRDFGDSQERADHELHLALVGMAVTRDRGLDLAGRIAKSGDAMLGGGQKNDTANFGQAQGGSHIEGGENGLDGNGVRGEFLNQAAQESVNLVQDFPG